MSIHFFKTLRTPAIAAVATAAAALSFTAQADNLSWMAAKNPALKRTTDAVAPATSDAPRIGTSAAWKQAKNPAVYVRTASGESDAAPAAKAQGNAAFINAKFRHLKRTASGD